MLKGFCSKIKWAVLLMAVLVICLCSVWVSDGHASVGASVEVTNQVDAGVHAKPSAIDAVTRAEARMSDHPRRPERESVMPQVDEQSALTATFVHADGVAHCGNLARPELGHRQKLGSPQLAVDLTKTKSLGGASPIASLANDPLLLM